MAKTAILLMLLLAMPVMAAGPNDELIRVFEQYNALAAKGDVKGAMAFRSKRARQEIIDNTKTPEEKEIFTSMFKALVPLSYTVEHVERSARAADCYIVGNYKPPNPELAGKTVREEMILQFIQEAGVWKLDTFVFGADPGDIKRSPDQKAEPESSYDLAKSTSIGGRIVSVDFSKDYTLVTIRMLGEEDLIYLPPKDKLEKSGLAVASLVPWCLLTADGHPHKTNKFKVLATSAAVKPLGIMGAQ